MSVPITIVDDSKMSRRLMMRSLPAEWEVEITQASNGLEALEAFRNGKAQVMFLDLTMPEMDGFQVLEAIKKEEQDAFIIVVSADIQPQAVKRVKSLGAMAFLKKPINTDKLNGVLRAYGII